MKCKRFYHDCPHLFSLNFNLLGTKIPLPSDTLQQNNVVASATENFLDAYEFDSQ